LSDKPFVAILIFLNLAESQLFSISVGKKIKYTKNKNTEIKYFLYFIPHHLVLDLIEHLGEWKTFTKLWQTTATTYAKPILAKLLKAKVIDL